MAPQSRRCCGVWGGEPRRFRDALSELAAAKHRMGARGNRDLRRELLGACNSRKPQFFHNIGIYDC